MGSKDNSPISRSQLLLGLNGLAFVIITAGVGLMQAFYAARGVQATNGPGLTRVDYAIIATQANILFPLGQLLLILGLAIVTSTLFQSVFYWKPWIEQAKKDEAEIVDSSWSRNTCLSIFSFLPGINVCKLGRGFCPSRSRIVGFRLSVNVVHVRSTQSTRDHR